MFVAAFRTSAHRGGATSAGAFHRSGGGAATDPSSGTLASAVSETTVMGSPSEVGGGLTVTLIYAVRSVGGRTSLMILTMTSIAVMPLNSDSGSSTMRCARQGIARIFTSSGTT